MFNNFPNLIRLALSQVDSEYIMAVAGGEAAREVSLLRERNRSDPAAPRP